MPLTPLYTLICDEVRVENNGKLIVIGLYTPNILLPQLPFTLPSLTFVQALRADRGGRFQFRARVQHLETGQELAQAIGIMEVAQTGLVINSVRFGNLVLDRFGLFNYIVSIEGQPDPITSEFEVAPQFRR